MKITINSHTIELESGVAVTIEKKLHKLSRFTGSDATATVVVTMATNHHKKGDVYAVEILVEDNGSNYHSKQTASSVVKAYTTAVDIVEQEIQSKNKKSTTLFKKGAQKIKQLLQFPK
jgi:ribosomal subunit interface protein